MIVGSIVQIVIAVALVIILCVVAFMIYNSEMLTAIRESGKIKKRTVIFDGVKDLSVSQNEAYNTIDPSHPMYRNIEDSINQKAGAEYTYNFWLFLGENLESVLESKNAPPDVDSYPDVGLTQKTMQNAGLANDKPMVLLLRGSKTAYPFKGLCYDNDASTMKVDVLVKQPMIKLERGGDVLSVELNTQTSPDAVKERSRDVCDYANPDWEQVNAYRIAVKGLKSRDGFEGNWNMITLVVQDTYPSDPLPLRNKIRVRLYVNGLLELDRYVDGKLADASSAASLLRANGGNLYFAPEIQMVRSADGTAVTLSNKIRTDGSAESAAQQLMMADLVYYNYAVDVGEIKSMFAGGFNKTYAATMTVNQSVGGTGEIISKIAYAGSEPRLGELGKALPS